MIKYKLCCSFEHEFEGWFRDSQDFDVQARDRLIECPACGDSDVRKAVMAPAVRTSSHARRDLPERFVEAAKRARAFVEKNFENVGERFPEEARKIHYGEAEERPVYGNATGDEVKALIDEGVSVAPLPGGTLQERKAPTMEDQKKLN